MNIRILKVLQLTTFGLCLSFITTHAYGEGKKITCHNAAWGKDCGDFYDNGVKWTDKAKCDEVGGYPTGTAKFDSIFDKPACKAN